MNKINNNWYVDKQDSFVFIGLKEGMLDFIILNRSSFFHVLKTVITDFDLDEQCDDDCKASNVAIVEEELSGFNKGIYFYLKPDLNNIDYLIKICDKLKETRCLI